LLEEVYGEMKDLRANIEGYVSERAELLEKAHLTYQDENFIARSKLLQNDADKRSNIIEIAYTVRRGLLRIMKGLESVMKSEAEQQEAREKSGDNVKEALRFFNKYYSLNDKHRKKCIADLMGVCGDEGDEADDEDKGRGFR
jgi:hypothetical protein